MSGPPIFNKKKRKFKKTKKLARPSKWELTDWDPWDKMEVLNGDKDMY